MRKYTTSQLEALVLAAEYRWQNASWGEAGEAKRSLYLLKDRLAFQRKVSK